MYIPFFNFPINFWARSTVPKSFKWTNFVVGGSVKPQALEGAGYDNSLSLWGILASFLCYTCYYIYSDFSARRNGSTRMYVINNEVTPQAEEIHAAGSLTTQNVKFVDGENSYMQETISDRDELRDAALNSDATLDNFFSRPIKIHSVNWGVGTTLYSKINPWQLYFQNLRVVNRISNYKLMRAKLHVKLTVNGTPFHYGRAIATYNPLHTYDDLTIIRAFLDADLVEATQRPHVYLNPTESMGGEMLLPFFTPYNLLDIVNEDWNEMGELVIATMNGLKHANGATDTVTINVFAWATEVDFAIPTQFEPGSIAPQGDEYSSRPISRPAAVVANVASKMTDLPVIGRYARATEIGASALGTMASLFGYSRPNLLEKSVYRPQNKGDFAVTNLPDDVNKLSLDAKQELTIDSRTVGLDGTDELTITSLAAREAYLTQFNWAVGAAPETLLWNAIVDPILHRKQSAEYHLTPTAFCTLPFEKWRGSMKFRFQVVGSKYHKGRLKIVYDPEATNNAVGGSEYNTAYTTIVDLSETMDFTMTVGWGQKTTYRNHLDLTTAQIQMFNTSALTYTSNTVSYGNGTISVYIVNELTVPNTLSNNDVSVNVFVSMCDDFELAQPTYQDVSKMRISASGIVEPQGDEYQPESKPDGSSVLDTHANKIPITDHTNHVHFGESVRSLRQLLKRYNMHEHLPLDVGASLASATKVRAWWIRYMFPHEPGYTASAGNVPITLVSGHYVYAHMTMLRYVSLAFVGWRGGVKWLYDFSTCNSFSTGSEGNYIISRAEPSILDNSGEALTTDMSTAANQALLISRNAVVDGKGGAIAQNHFVNPMVSVEVPYYSEYRFTPCKQRAAFTGLPSFNTPQIRAQIVRTCSEEDYVTTWCAAAEDLNFYFFVGTPILYRESAPPTA